jgi:hypothetical protein
VEPRWQWCSSSRSSLRKIAMPRSVDRSTSSRQNDPNDSPSPPRKPSQSKYSADPTNVVPARAKSPAARLAQKVFTPAAHFAETAKAVEARLRTPLPTDKNPNEIAADAYLKLSNESRATAQQKLAFAQRALELAKSANPLDGYVEPNILQRNIEALFLQATGVKWLPPSDKTTYNCDPKKFDPDAFLRYMDLVHTPSGFRIDGGQSDEFLTVYCTVADKVNDLYRSPADRQKVLAALETHAENKARAMEAQFHGVSNEQHEDWRVAGDATIDAYIDLSRVRDGRDGNEPPCILKAIEIHEMIHGPDARNERLGKAAVAGSSKFLEQVAGPTAGSFYGERIRKFDNFKPELFIKYCEMNRKAFALQGAPDMTWERFLPHYDPVDQQRVADALRPFFATRDLPRHKNDVGLNFDNPITALIAGYSA